MRKKDTTDRMSSNAAFPPGRAPRRQRRNVGGFRAFAARSAIIVSRELIERVRNLEQ